MTEAQLRAELAALAEVQDLPLADDLDRAVELVSGPLRRHLELELRSDCTRIDVVTLTEKQETSGFFELLTERGATEEQLATGRALTRFGAGAVLGMKFPVAGPTSGGEIYIRRGLPISEVAYFLGRHGVGDEALAKIRELGGIFHKEHTHILACDAAVVPSFTVFYTTYLEAGAEERDETMVRSALELVGLSSGGVDKAMAQHRFASASRPESLFFSARIRGGELQRVAKLDYVGPRYGVLTQLLADVCGAGSADMALRWAEKLHTNHVSYMGLVLTEEGPEAVRAYFTRVTGIGSR